MLLIVEAVSVAELLRGRMHHDRTASGLIDASLPDPTGSVMTSVLFKVVNCGPPELVAAKEAVRFTLDEVATAVGFCAWVGFPSAAAMAEAISNV